MKKEIWGKLERELPPITGRLAPPNEDEIDEAARAIGCTFHKDYREFLRRFGSGIVGPNPIYGIRPAESMGNLWSVVEVTESFRSEAWPGTNDWYVISADGFGNPIGVSPDGRVWISDHDAGEISEIARDFGDFVESCYKR